MMIEKSIKLDSLVKLVEAPRTRSSKPWATFTSSTAFKKTACLLCGVPRNSLRIDFHTQPGPFWDPDVPIHQVERRR